jgi:hypothetical protein
VDVAPLVLRENAHGVEAVDRAGSWSVSDGAKRDRQPGGDTEERAAPVYRDRMETEMVEAADDVLIGARASGCARWYPTLLFIVPLELNDAIRCWGASFGWAARFLLRRSS